MNTPNDVNGIKKPSMANIPQKHETVQDVVDSFRAYYREESAYINELAKQGTEHDKQIAREISRVIDNVDRICRIAESYAKRNS